MNVIMAISGAAIAHDAKFEALLKQAGGGGASFGDVVTAAGVLVFGFVVLGLVFGAFFKAIGFVGGKASEFSSNDDEGSEINIYGIHPQSICFHDDDD